MNKSIHFDTIEHHATFGEQQHTDSSFKDYDQSHYATVVNVQQFYAGPEADSDPHLQHQYATTTPTAAQYYNNPQYSENLKDHFGIKHDEEPEQSSNPEDQL